MGSAYHMGRKLRKETLLNMYESALPQPAMFPGGKVFFVDGSSGSNSNDGTTRAKPFLTVTHALTKCTTRMHDTIYVRDDNENSNETWPIVINKQNVHLIGLSNPYNARCTIRPTGDTQAITCGSTGYGSEITNIEFGGGNSYACIEITGTGKLWIHDCQFGTADAADTPLHGILSKSGATNVQMLIEDCVFNGDLQQVPGKILSNGIEASGNALLRHGIIRNNMFMGVAIGINLGGNNKGVMILDNRFMCDGAGTGEAITLANGCRGCLVDGNSAADRQATTSATAPYVDGGTAGYNAWGINYAGGVAVWPQ